MANLLDAPVTNDDRMAVLGLLGGSLVRGDFGGGLLSANNYLNEAPDRRMKQALMGAQINNFNSEVQQRAAAIERQNQILDMAKRIALGGGGGSSASTMPGQLGSGSFGIVQPPAGQSDIPALRPQGIAGANYNDIVALHALGGPDLREDYKFARTGIERKPGTFYEDLNGRRQYITDLNNGRTMDANGVVGLAPGFTDTLTATTFATEAPKALLNAAATINLRKNADNTESPVSALDENPTLQNILGTALGRKNVGAPTQAVPAPPTTAAVPQMDGSPDAQSTPYQRAQSDVAAITKEIERVKASNAPDSIKQMQLGVLMPELDKATKAQGGVVPVSTSAAPVEQPPSVVRKPGSYGPTFNEQARAEANKAYDTDVAKTLAKQRENIMVSGQNAPQNIARYQQIGTLLKDVDGGTLTPTGTHLASLANSVGLKIDKNLPNKQAAESLANQAALELRNPAGGAGMPGAMSDQDREFLKSMTPNMAQSAEGRAKVIEAYVLIQQRNQNVATFARNYENKYGRLDNRFFEQLQQWSNANPLFRSK